MGQEGFHEVCGDDETLPTPPTPPSYTHTQGVHAGGSALTEGKQKLFNWLIFVQNDIFLAQLKRKYVLLKKNI